MPDNFYNWKNNEKASFIKGLYSANGGIIKNERISFKTTSIELIKELINYFKTIDIECYYTTNKEKEVKFKNGNYTCKESYDLNISKIESIIIFANKISFIHNYKNNHQTV